MVMLFCANFHWMKIVLLFKISKSIKKASAKAILLVYSFPDKLLWLSSRHNGWETIQIQMDFHHLQDSCGG